MTKLQIKSTSKPVNISKFTLSSLQLTYSPVGYGLRGSPGCQVRGAQTAFEALIRWANLISSSDETGRLFALLMDCSFCFA